MAAADDEQPQQPASSSPGRNGIEPRPPSEHGQATPPIASAQSAPAPRAPPPRPASLLALYKVFFWMGLFSFGGGMTAWFHREVVLIRGWMTDEDFFSGYAFCQVLPGVNSTNMAAYIGQRLRGFPGAVTTLLGLLSGPFVIVIACAMAYRHLIEFPLFNAAVAGIAAAAIGLLLRLGITTARESWRDYRAPIVIAVTFFAVGVMKWPLVPVVLVVGPLSVAAAWFAKSPDA
jgi:chromate transporter